MPSVSFVEVNHQWSWLHESRHAVRLMLPQVLVQSKNRHVWATARLPVWVHAVESTRRLYRLVGDAKATIQKVTFSHRGGRWQVSFQVRFQVTHAPTPKPHRRLGDVAGVDQGVKHLAILSQIVPGVTDELRPVANPQVPQQDRRRLRRLGRRIARCEPGSKNRAELVTRRARLHGQVTTTRLLHLHAPANVLAGGFSVVGIEDLCVKGISNRKRRLGRSFADASLAESRRIFAYKTTDRGHRLVVVDRFYPSSTTCLGCSQVKVTLALPTRVFDCDHCGVSRDRDVDAAHNIAREAVRLTRRSSPSGDVAGLRPETRNAASR